MSYTKDYFSIIRAHEDSDMINLFLQANPEAKIGEVFDFLDKNGIHSNARDPTKHGEQHSKSDGDGQMDSNEDGAVEQNASSQDEANSTSSQEDQKEPNGKRFTIGIAHICPQMTKSKDSMGSDTNKTGLHENSPSKTSPEEPITGEKPLLGHYPYMERGTKQLKSNPWVKKVIAMNLDATTQIVDKHRCSQGYCRICNNPQREAKFALRV